MFKPTRLHPTDVYQFANQIDQANQTLENGCTTSWADAGYANPEEAEEIDAQHIQVIVPNNLQDREQEEGQFAKSKFTYNAERNKMPNTLWTFAEKPRDEMK